MKNKKLLLLLLLACSFFANSFAQSRVAIINTKTYLPVSADVAKYDVKFAMSLSVGESYFNVIKAKSAKYSHVISFKSEKINDSNEITLTLAKETEDISGFLVTYFKNIGIDQLMIDETTIKTEDFYVFMRNRSKPVKENNPQVEK